MANAIDFDQDIITDNEPRLLKTKRAMLNKLRVTFCEPHEIAVISDQHAGINSITEIFGTLATIRRSEGRSWDSVFKLAATGVLSPHATNCNSSNI